MNIKMEGATTTLLEWIDSDYYKYFIYIDRCGKNACMQNPIRLYTALYRHPYSSWKNSPKSYKKWATRGMNMIDVLWKNVKGRQCTILWYADDLNASHVDSDIVSIILAYIDAEYGKIKKMTITRGNIHKYVKSSPQSRAIHVTCQPGLISQKSSIKKLVTNPGHKCQLATVCNPLN